MVGSTTRASRALALAMVLGACGADDEVTAPDAAADAETPDGIVNIPWLSDGRPPVAAPMLTPCRPGWSEVTHETGIATCEPYPESGVEDCGPGEAHLPGTPTCAPMGGPCPAGAFADDLPSDRPIVYVREGATGGDGTEALPYGDLGTFSLGALARDSVLALGAGRYSGDVNLRGGFSLRGACATATEITSSTRTDLGGVVQALPGGTVEIRNLRIGRSERPGIWAVGPDVEAIVRGVEVTEASTLGVGVFDGATLDVSDLVVRDIRPDPAGSFGRGLVTIANGASVSVTRAAFERNCNLGVFAADTASVSLTDAVVRDTGPDPGALDAGGGVAIERGASATFDGIVLLDNLDHALLGHVDWSITASDVVVRDTGPRAVDGRFGGGLSVQLSGTLDLRRGLVERNRRNGLYADTDVDVRVEDLLVSDTRTSAEAESGGRGLIFQDDVRGTLVRVVASLSRGLGVDARGSDVSVSLSDLLVHDTRIDDSGSESSGRGVHVVLGASVELERFVVDECLDAGIFATDDATVAITDGLVRAVNASSPLGRFGRSVTLQSRSTLTGARVVLEQAREVGVVVSGSALDLMHLEMRDVLPRACADTTCPTLGAGHGLAVAEGSARFTSFRIARVPLCGVLVLDGAEVDLSNGEVTDCEIGACVQAPGYDAARLSDGVVYRDVGLALDATTLPVPEAQMASPSPPP